MPDNKNQGNRKNQGVDREGDQGLGRQQQGHRGQQGDKGSTQIERDDVNPVGNDNDLDRDLERQDMDMDEDEDRITQRSPRVGDRDRQRE